MAATAKPARKMAVKFDPARRRKFLAAYRLVGVIRAGCDAANVSRNMVDYARQNDETFRQAFDDARDHAADLLEEEARRRAELGTQKLAISGGKVVLHDGKPVMITEYSDRLMELMLKAVKPERFRERIEHSGDPARPVVVQMLPGDGRL